MFAKNDETMLKHVESYLPDDEEALAYAFGVKQPSMLIIIPLMILGILPGVIATALLTKNYLIILTRKRFIVLQVNDINTGEIKEVIEYRLDEVTTLKPITSTGAVFTHINIKDEARPFVAKFHRSFSKMNRDNAIAISDVISGRSSVSDLVRSQPAHV